MNHARCHIAAALPSPTATATRSPVMVGFVNASEFPLSPDDGQRADRVPGRDELQALFDSITVDARDLVTEAERAYQ